MTLYLTDLPRPVAREDYDKCIELLIGHLDKMAGLISIIGFGSVSSPGISDIDLLAVFEDGREATFYARDILPAGLGYLVTHNVAAMCRSHYLQSPRFTVWHRQESLWGEDIAVHYHYSWSQEELRALQVQTALEFLITNYIDFATQRAYGIVKLRSLLQHLKALSFDLEFLGVNCGPVFDRIQEVRGWIARWFTMSTAERPMGRWLPDFFAEYERFIDGIFQQYALYLPERAVYQLSANIRLLPGSRISQSRRGLVLPRVLGFLGRRFFNLQHRLNQFVFTAPIVHQHPIPLIAERFRFFRRVSEYHRQHFGRFMPLTPPLPAKLS
jgi:hypothetical protein